MAVFQTEDALGGAKALKCQKWSKKSHIIDQKITKVTNSRESQRKVISLVFRLFLLTHSSSPASPLAKDALPVLMLSLLSLHLGHSDFFRHFGGLSALSIGPKKLDHSLRVVVLHDVDAFI